LCTSEHHKIRDIPISWPELLITASSTNSSSIVRHVEIYAVVVVLVCVESVVVINKPFKRYTYKSYDKLSKIGKRVASVADITIVIQQHSFHRCNWYRFSSIGTSISLNVSNSRYIGITHSLLFCYYESQSNKHIFYTSEIHQILTEKMRINIHITDSPFLILHR
jgi:hypothetical protein